MNQDTRRENGRDVGGHALSLDRWIYIGLAIGAEGEMTSLIQQQQELVAQVLEHSNRIDTIVRETVIIVPDILAENKLIREKMMKIFELEQKVLLDIIFPVGSGE